MKSWVNKLFNPLMYIDPSLCSGKQEMVAGEMGGGRTPATRYTLKYRHLSMWWHECVLLRKFLCGEVL